MESASGVSRNKLTVLKGGADYWLVKIDATGAKSWETGFGTFAYDAANDLLQNADGTYMLLGYGNGTGLGAGDKTEASAGAWLIKTGIPKSINCGGVYVKDVDNSPFKYFDPSTNTTTTLPNPSFVTNSLGLAVDGSGNAYTVQYHTTANQPLKKFSPNTNTWTDLANCPLLAVISLVFDGKYIYALAYNAPGGFARYDIATNTWTTMTTGPWGNGGAETAVSDGTSIFTIGNGVNELYKYNIVGNTWVTLPIPNPVLRHPLVYNGFYLYVLRSASPFQLYQYNMATNTWTDKANAPNQYVVTMASDGSKLYAITTNTRDFYSYNIGTNTWSSVLTTDASFGNTNFRAIGVCLLICNPTATASITQVTCTSGNPNSDGKITFSAVSGAIKVDYTAGSTYTGAGFASASTISALPFDVTSTLANPTVPQPYTVRIFNSVTCYKDYVLTLSPKQCRTADLSVTVAPVTATKNMAETATYVVTVANAGSDAANNVKVKVNIPVNGTLQAAVANQVSYTDNTKIWDVGSIANGASKTLTISVKVN